MKNIGLFYGGREKILNYFKSRIFPIKDKVLTQDREKAPEQAPGAKLAPKQKLAPAQGPEPKLAPK